MDVLSWTYNEGKITHNTKQLLSSYYFYNESAEIDATTFNDLAIIFENNIVEAEILSDAEAEQTLSLISIVKYDNALYPIESMSRTRGCGQRAIGGFLLGFLHGGFGLGIFAAAYLYLSCEFLG